MGGTLTTGHLLGLEGLRSMIPRLDAHPENGCVQVCQGDDETSG